MLIRLKNFWDAKIYLFSNKYKKIYQRFYFNYLRKRLRNKDFSLFSPNCYAGIIYHRLKLQFKSPTINMFFPSKKQYLKFCCNIKYYLTVPLIECKDERFPYPVGLLEDIEIVFNHSKTFEEAYVSWNNRKKRVNYDNIFLIFDDYVDAEYDDLIQFNKIPCQGKVILTAKEYENLDNVIQIKNTRRIML